MERPCQRGTADQSHPGTGSSGPDGPGPIAGPSCLPPGSDRAATGDERRGAPRSATYLPEDVLVEALKVLPSSSLGMAACVSRDWRAAAGTDALWRRAFLLEFGGTHPHLTPCPAEPTEKIGTPDRGAAGLITPELGHAREGATWRQALGSACRSPHRPYLCNAGRMQAVVGGVASWRVLVRPVGPPPPPHGGSPAGGGWLRPWAAVGAEVEASAPHSLWLRFAWPAGDGAANGGPPAGGAALLLQKFEVKVQALVPEGQFAITSGDEETAWNVAPAAGAKGVAQGGGGSEGAAAGRRRGAGATWRTVMHVPSFQLLAGSALEEVCMLQAHRTGLQAYTSDAAAGPEGTPQEAGGSDGIYAIAYLHTEQLLLMLPPALQPALHPGAPLQPPPPPLPPDSRPAPLARGAGDRQLACHVAAPRGALGAEEAREGRPPSPSPLWPKALRVYCDFISLEGKRCVGSCAALLQGESSSDSGAQTWAGPVDVISAGATLASLAGCDVVVDVSVFDIEGKLVLGRAAIELWSDGCNSRSPSFLHFIPDDSAEGLFVNAISLIPPRTDAAGNGTGPREGAARECDSCCGGLIGRLELKLTADGAMRTFQRKA